MTTRRRFAPLDAGYFDAVKVELMGEEFGTVGVAVPVALLAAAETQNRLALDGSRGVVRMTYRRLAQQVWSDSETARKVVERWAELGEMVDVSFRELDFEATWKDWDVWQPAPTDTKLTEAKQFLTVVLGNGPRTAAEVGRLAEDRGISEMTLKRARSDLNVQTTGGPGAALSLP